MEFRAASHSEGGVAYPDVIYGRGVSTEYISGMYHHPAGESLDHFLLLCAKTGCRNDGCDNTKYESVFHNPRAKIGKMTEKGNQYVCEYVFN